MADLTPDLLTWEQARDWAQTKAANEMVGVAVSCEMDPLATCLHELNPDHAFEVDNLRVQIDGEGRQTLSDWMRRAVRKVDMRMQGTPVTASEFLAILDAVKPESGVAE